MSKQEFINDEKTQSSVLYQFVIIGEAVNRLSETFKAQYSRPKWVVNAIQGLSPPTPLGKGGANLSLFMIHLVLLYPQVPFNEMRGLRNRVVHEYKRVDSDIIWETIQSDITLVLNIIDFLTGE